MKYLAAYALAWLSGKASPSVKDLEGIVKASGGDFDANKANSLIEALKDKSINELVAAGRSKLNGISLGVGAPATNAVVATKETPAEVKDDKKDKGDDEDAAMEGGMGLFGDEEW